MSRGAIRLLATACLLTCAPAPRSVAVERATAVSSPASLVMARAQPRRDALERPRRVEPVPGSRVAAPALRSSSTAQTSRPRPAAGEPVLADVGPAPGPAADEPVLADALPPASAEPPPSRKDSLEMTFVGDVIFGRYREDGYDPIPEEGQPVFEEVAALMRSDLLVGNLETPLVDALPERTVEGASYSFGADATLARFLVHGGFDAMSLANNHAYDLGGSGVEQTPEILARLGVVPLGSARAEAPLRVETVEREGWRVGFVAVTTVSNVDALVGVPPLPRVELGELAERLSGLVEDARASHDLVVVLVHWGDEYADEPSWAQRRAAFTLVEAGADLVIGHHPHVLQGVERHGHGVIAYSLGNFLFENVKDVPRQTGVLRTRFDARGCLEAVVFHPAFVKSVPTKHPAPAVGHMGGKVKERMQALSRPLGQGWRDEGDDLVLEGLGCSGSRGPAPAPRIP
ncbi:MAG: CapA family protein [Myxococcales bacterium]|nr:CapA family protein [Myxococcales bacterium]MCB9717192.1 CapA family protein [Myxococcales bacterium]